MSDSRIRELLTDFADSAEAPDFAERAWSAAGPPRARLLAVTAGALAAAIAVAATVIATVVAERHHHRAGDRSPATHGRAELNVQIAPPVEREPALPHRDIGLPAVIHLDRHAADVTSYPIGRAIAAFGVSTSTARTSTQVTVVLIAPDGTQRTLDVSKLRQARAAGGGTVPPLGATSLAPDGTKLVLAERGGVVTYSLVTERWTHFRVVGYPTDEPAWNRDGSIQVGNGRIDPGTKRVTNSPVSAPRWPSALDVERPWGPARSVADRTAQEALLRSSPRPVDDPAPEAVVVSGRDPAVLLIPHVGGQERYIGCCAVAGWSGTGTVIYESRLGPESTGQVTRLLAWDVARHGVALAATVTAGPRTLITGSYPRFPS